MLSKLLSACARLGIQHPGPVIAMMGVPLLIGVSALRVPLDLSFSGLMDRDHPEVARYFEASDRYGLGGLLPLLIEGPDEAIDEAVLALRLALDELDMIRSTAPPPPREWLLANAPWLVDSETFDHWLEFARGPLDSQSFAELKAALEDLERTYAPLPPEGARLLLVTLKEDSFELALDSSWFPTIRSLTRETLAPFGASGRFAGMPAIVTQEKEATLERMRILAPISLVLVLILFAGIERRVSILLSAAVPLLLSVGCTLGLIGFFVGKFTIMESVFGVVVFGLGVDFAIHLLLRVREEQSRGRDFAASLQVAIEGTGRGIVSGGLTTGGAFLILALAPDPVFQRLGLAGGLGLLLCLVFLLLLLPALWSLVDRRETSAAHRPQSSLVLPLCAACVRASVRAPAITLGLAAAVLVACVLSLPNLRYQTNLEQVFSRDIEAVDTARRIHELFGVDPGPWMVPVRSLDEAREVTAAFAADPLFERSESLSFLFREDRDERVARLASEAPALARRVRERQLEAIETGVDDAEGFAESVAAVEALLRAQVLGPPRLEQLPESLSQRLLGPEGELLVYAYLADPALDSAVAARERAAAQAIHPEATSISAVYEALVGTDRPWMPPLVAAVMLFIALVLYADFRSPRLVLLALVPVVSGSLVTLGVLSWAGFSFNTVTLVGIPLLLGLGVDDGIHIVHRMLEQPHEPLENVVAAVSRSIAMTTLTTCASVATLLLTRHPGIESLAILLLLGLPLCLLASVTLLPATAVLLRIHTPQSATI